MTVGSVYAFVRSADLSDDALSAIKRVPGVDSAYAVTGAWDVQATIESENWTATMQGIRNAPGVYSVNQYLAT
jgi:hypothetical protein